VVVVLAMRKSILGHHVLAAFNRLR
jgi:hypothetical protein